MTDNLFAPDEYKIEKALGTGGTARVHLGLRLTDNHPYALKTVIKSSPDEIKQFRRLARREYDLIMGQRYPGLVRIFDFHDDPDYPFLSMEFCPDRTLDELPGLESPDILMNILSSISINLHYLKLNGLYHGDLKPQNIFLAGDLGQYSGDRMIYTKISDFSLALKEGEKNDCRLGLGTVGYMAPETIDSEEINHKSDIFAFGVIAYYLATGRHPFMEDETDPVRINAAIKETTPPPPAETNNSISQKLSDLIMSMLDRDPGRRPSSSFEICRKLEDCGCRYPYGKMIRPKHLMHISADRTGLNRLTPEAFNFEPEIEARLTDFTGENCDRLRHLLEIYFTDERLVWAEGRLTFRCPASELTLPRRLQRYDRETFFALPYSGRKKIVLTAVCGGREQAEAIGIISTAESSEYITSPLLRYAAENISGITRRRFSEKIADHAFSKYQNHRIASVLYLKAGNLEKAYTTTLDASNELINANKYEPAFAILNQLAALCRDNDDIKKLRLVLMQIADTEKMTGETARAEKNYHEIIALYENSPHDKLLAETHKDLGDLYRMKQDYENGLQALHQAESLYTELDDRLELSRTLNNIGNILAMLGRFDESLLNYRKALKMQHRLEVWEAVASTLNNMGAIFFFRGLYSRTLSLFEIALKLQKIIGNAGEIARTLNNLGCVYQETAQLDSALNCLNESLGYNRKIESKRELLINLDNLTAVMYLAGRLKDSIGHIKEGIKLAEELSDKPLLATFNHHLALVQKRMGYYGQALQTFNKALDFFSQVNDFPHESECLVELGDLYYRLNTAEQTESSLQRLRELAEKVKDKKLFVGYYCLTALINNDLDTAQKGVLTAVDINAPLSINSSKLRLALIRLKRKDISGAGEALQELSEVYQEANSNIENASFFNIYGNYLQETGDNAGAISYYQKAYQQASRTSLRPEMAEALAGIGSIKNINKEYEGGFKNIRQAINIVRSMADDIKDERLKKSFLTNEKIVSMAGEVKKLSQILAQKKKAGR